MITEWTEQLVLDLGRHGFSVACIARRLRVTENQVRYRLAKHDVHLSDYRDGRGAVAGAVLKRLVRPKLRLRKVS